MELRIRAGVCTKWMIWGSRNGAILQALKQMLERSVFHAYSLAWQHQQERKKYLYFRSCMITRLNSLNSTSVRHLFSVLCLTLGSDSLTLLAAAELDVPEESM